MSQMTRIFSLSRLFPLLLLATACAKSEPPVVGMKIGKPYAVEGKTYTPAYEPSYDKVGEASWYGPGFHGKYTASGERFNQDDLTAAHPTLPMPSLVRVTNLTNGKSVIARINDRGPFKSNRIIDLSKKTAMTIGLLSTGKVRVQYLPNETAEYIDTYKSSGKAMSMTAFNDRRAASEPEDDDDEQIVEASDATTNLGQTVTEAAPIQSVSSGTLSGSVKSNDLPAPDAASGVKVTPMTYADKGGEQRYIRDETGQPVHLKGASDHDSTYEEKAPTPVAAAKPVAKLAAKPSLIKDAAADEAPKKAALAPSGAAAYHIQVGSFASEENARKLHGKLSAIAPVNIVKLDAAGKEWWRVRLGPFASNSEASAALDKVHEAGLADARIVH